MERQCFSISVKNCSFSVKRFNSLFKKILIFQALPFSYRYVPPLNIVITVVYLTYDLRKKLRIFSPEKIVYLGVKTVDFSYLGDYSRGEEVESNSIVLEIP